MRKILALILLPVFFANLLPGACSADTNILPFDEKVYYDIYLHGKNEPVIRHIKVSKQVEIGQRVFLVIEPSSFNLENNQGYVNLDNVSAILPSTKFKVEETGGKFWLFHGSEDKK